MLVVGSVTLLGDGSVTQRPAVWRSPGPDGPWTRTELPGDGSLGEARFRLLRRRRACTVVGAVDGALRGWAFAPDGSVTALGLPALAVGEHDLLPPPLLRGPEATVVLASGGVLRVLTVSGDGIREGTGPPARAVRSTARTAAGDFVVLEDPSGAARLVRLGPPGGG